MIETFIKMIYFKASGILQIIFIAWHWVKTQRVTVRKNVEPRIKGNFKTLIQGYPARVTMFQAESLGTRGLNSGTERKEKLKKNMFQLLNIYRGISCPITGIPFGYG